MHSVSDIHSICQILTQTGEEVMRFVSPYLHVDDVSLPYSVISFLVDSTLPDSNAILPELILSQKGKNRAMIGSFFG
jgi:hypothetical protein